MSKITQGFVDPVQGAQRVFRTVLDAMARPGSLGQLDSELRFGTASAAASQILLTLADQSTPLWLDASFGEDEALIENIRFHLAAPRCSAPEQASFALLRAGQAIELEAFSQGAEEYPETSTTLIVEVTSFERGPSLSLRGPGIDGTTCVQIEGLSLELLSALSARNCASPQGVDLLLTAGATVLALPRSTHISQNSAEANPCMSR